jgi:ADP-ribose pyrophosphatase YjhB (NUDIX family)
MAREAIPTWFFALVVVRLGRRFLLVHERKHGQLWYLPAGRVEPGESLVEGAVRETFEETGVKVTIDGLLRLEHSPRPDAARVRAIFIATPVDDTPPKQQPDDETLGAAWFTLEELEQLPLRGGEVREIFRAVAAGCPVYPLKMLTTEGAVWST